MGTHMLTLARGLAATHRVTLAFPEAAAGFAEAARSAGLAARAFAAGEEEALVAALGPGPAARPRRNWLGGPGAWRSPGAARIVRTEHLPWLIKQDDESQAAGTTTYCLISHGRCSVRTTREAGRRAGGGQRVPLPADAGVDVQQVGAQRPSSRAASSR